jgi:hypothetical protein
MPVYRKTVEAFQWDGKSDLSETPKWFISLMGKGFVRVVERENAPSYLEIKNPKGKTESCFSGSYVIQDADGSIEIMQQRVFESKYQPVKEETPARTPKPEK